MTRASAIALQASWAAQEADELAQMRQRARERLAEIDAEGVDWAGLKDLSAGRMTAGRDAVVAELRGAQDWWQSQLREQGYDEQMIRRLLAEYEQAFTQGLSGRIAGF